MTLAAGGGALSNIHVTLRGVRRAFTNGRRRHGRCGASFGLPDGHLVGSPTSDSGSGSVSRRARRVRTRRSRWAWHQRLALDGSEKLPAFPVSLSPFVRPLPEHQRAPEIAILRRRVRASVRSSASCIAPRRQLAPSCGTNAATGPDSSGYRAVNSQRHADRRARRPKLPKVAQNDKLRDTSRIVWSARSPRQAASSWPVPESLDRPPPRPTC